MILFQYLLALMLNETRSVFLKKTIQNITYTAFLYQQLPMKYGYMFYLRLREYNKHFKNLIGQDTIDLAIKRTNGDPYTLFLMVWKILVKIPIIYLAALSGVDPQLEAAHIDGASRVQRIWHINVPGIIPTAVLLFIMSCGQIMSVGFEKVYLLQNSLNLSVSEVISTYVYKTGLLGAKFSYTSAIGLFNSLINVTLLLIVNKISSKVSGIMLF